MSITLIERHGVSTSSSAVHSSSRRRVAWPRRPGTRPSVVAIGSGASARGTADDGTDGPGGRPRPALPARPAPTSPRRLEPRPTPGHERPESRVNAVVDAPAAPVLRPLTRAQQARRQRVIDAAMALGLDGGYDAVQMRDVAARAGVAMGTVYRYFTSKDHLLAAALVHWVEQLDARLAQMPAQGETASARVMDALDRALRAMGRQPR